MSLPFTKNRTRSILRITSLFFLLSFAAFVVGMRSLTSGFDTESYIGILEAAKSIINQGGNFQDFYFEFSYVHPEPLYSAFVYFLAYIDCSPRIYILIVAFFSIFVFGLAINAIDKHHGIEVFILVLCSLTFVFLFSNTMRQGISVGIAFYAISKLLSKDTKGFLFWIIFASMFHSSALIMIVLVFFIKRSIHVLFVIFGLTALLTLSIGFVDLFSFINVPVISDKLKYYSAGGNAQGWSFYSAIVMPIILYSILYNNKNHYLLELYKVHLTLCIVCLLFSSGLTMFDRISAYRFLFEPLIFIALCHTVKQKSLAMAFILTMAFIYFILVVYSSDAIHKTLYY